MNSTVKLLLTIVRNKNTEGWDMKNKLLLTAMLGIVLGIMIIGCSADPFVGTWVGTDDVENKLTFEDGKVTIILAENNKLTYEKSFLIGTYTHSGKTGVITVYGEEVDCTISGTTLTLVESVTFTKQ
jgi:hypothetical protein